MKNEQRICGLVMGKNGWGTIACSGCGRILGYVVKEHYLNLYLHFFCPCGSNGYLAFGHIPDPQLPIEAADQNENGIYCTNCGREWFTISDDVKGYCFWVQCICGHVFDRGYMRKRNLYGELNF